MAETICSPPDPRGLQQCTSGIRSPVIDEHFQAIQVPNMQEQSQWCWAASISMAFAQHGYRVPQERIVRDTFGDIRNWPAQGYQIQQALSRDWTDDAGRRFRSRTRVFDLQSGQMQISNMHILRELDAGRPLIYGAQGHATLLTAAQYLRHPQSGAFQIMGGTVRDPWPGRGRRQLMPQELSPIFVATVEVAPLGQPAPGDAPRGSGTASGGPLCGAVETVIRASADEFRSLRGRRTERGYAGTFLVGSAEFCSIRDGSSRAKYTCYGGNTTRAAAMSQGQRYRTELASCLGGWDQSSEPDSEYPLNVTWEREGLEVNLYVTSLSDGEWYWTISVRAE